MYFRPAIYALLYLQTILPRIEFAQTLFKIKKKKMNKSYEKEKYILFNNCYFKRLIRKVFHLPANDEAKG